MANKTEFRNYEIRASKQDDFVLEGRALSYGQVSSNELWPGTRERIQRGAFTTSLASGKDVKALLNHDSSALPLGRTENGTLKISDGPDGLDFRVQLDKDNVFHQSVFASVKRGDINQCSFAFICQDESCEDGIAPDGTACKIRNIRKADLLDCSIVNSPFYGDGATDVAARTKQAADDAARLARALAMPGDWARQEKATELGKAFLNEVFTPTAQRGSQDFLKARATTALAAKSLDYCAHDSDYVYGSDPDDADEENCLRFGYSVDDDGNLALDDEGEECAHALTHAARAAKRQRTADKELAFRMRVARGF